MDFALTDEQEMIVDTVRTFVDRELVPHEDDVERLGEVPPDLVKGIRRRSLDAGIYAANMPTEFGGGGLDNLTMAMVDRAFGWTQYALHYIVARPSNILQACTGDQVEDYLAPTVRGERVDCLAMSEPGAGSDIRGMSCRAERQGDDYLINGTKHFISHADLADYTILFAATGEEQTARGPKKLITAFLVDHDTPGFEMASGYNCVSNRGYHNMILQIGKFQGVSFKLADMRTKLTEAELMTYRAAWRMDRDHMTDGDAAMAKISSTEMLQFVADEAIQILGGMGLMDELPLERIWRDARVDRIWDGTSEIQRHIISREMLRPLGG